MIANAWRRWWRAERGDSLLFDCLLTWHVALLGSLLLVIAAHALVSGAGGDVSALQKPAVEIRSRSLLFALLLAPLLETVVLGLLLRALQYVTSRAQWLALVSALAWGGLHAAVHPLWFFGTVWSFFVFSRAWLAWRPVSYKHAFAAAAVPHALVNASALMMQYFAGS